MHASNLQALGATHVVSRDEPLTSETLAAMTTSPLSLAFDAVGIDVTQQAGYRLLAPGGTLITVLPDSVDKGGDEQGRKVVFISGSAWPESNRALARAALQALPGYLEQGLIKPNDHELVPGGLAAIPNALRRLEDGKAGGVKLVVHPQTSA